MPKKPEQVLKQDEITASSRLKKGRVKIFVSSIVIPPANTGMIALLTSVHNNPTIMQTSHSHLHVLHQILQMTNPDWHTGTP